MLEGWNKCCAAVRMPGDTLEHPKVSTVCMPLLESHLPNTVISQGRAN